MNPAGRASPGLTAGRGLKLMAALVIAPLAGRGLK